MNIHIFEYSEFKLNIFNFFPYLNWIWINKNIKKSIWIELNNSEYSNSFELFKFSPIWVRSLSPLNVFHLKIEQFILVGWDSKLHGPELGLQAMINCAQYLVSEEGSQLRGVILIIDARSISLRQIKQLGLLLPIKFAALSNVSAFYFSAVFIISF